MIILPMLTTSLIRLSLEGWGNVLFELGSERVQLVRDVHIIGQSLFRSNDESDANFLLTDPKVAHLT